MYAASGWTNLRQIRSIVDAHCQAICPETGPKDCLRCDFGAADRAEYRRFLGVSTKECALLARWLPEGNLLDKQNRAPRCVDFIQMSKKYPDQLLLGGYLIGPERNDERLTFDCLLVDPALTASEFFDSSKPFDAENPARTQDTAGIRLFEWMKIALADDGLPDEIDFVSFGGRLWSRLWWD